VLFVVSPVLGTTAEEALARKKASARPRLLRAVTGQHLVGTDITFASSISDEPLPQLETNGREQVRWTSSRSGGSGKTLRQLVLDAGRTSNSIDPLSAHPISRRQMGE